MAESPEQILKSWKAIADYLGSTVSTVRRWERGEGLPVRRQEHIKRGSVIAYKHELDVWQQSRTTALPEAPSDRLVSLRPSRARLSRIAGVALIGLRAVGASGWIRLDRDWNLTELGLGRLTAVPGSEQQISFAPGGLAYAYVQDGSEVLVQATGSAARSIWKPVGKAPCCLNWSPDGKWIAISQEPDSGSGYETVAVDPTGEAAPREPFPGGPEVAWTRDSHAIIFARRLGTDPSRIFLRALAGGEVRQLTYPAASAWGDTSASVSPDGQRLAFVRYFTKGIGDVYVSAFGRPEAKRITKIENWITGLDWMPDGKHIVLGTNHAGRLGLFHVDADGRSDAGYIERTEGSIGDPRVVVVEKDRWRIGYTMAESMDSNLTLLNPAAGSVSPIAHSSRGEESPALSDDGNLAFRSDRLGGHDLWVCPLHHCDSPRRLTHNTEDFVAAMPRWSPDGRRLAFVQRVKGKPSILLVDADGANLRVLSTGYDEGAPAWSADGATIFFRSDRSGTPQIWRTAADSPTAPMQLTKHAGVEAYAAADGRHLLFLNVSDNAALMRIFLLDGTEDGPVKGVPPLRDGNWAVVGNSLFYFGRGAKADGFRVHRFDFATGRTHDVHSGPDVFRPLGLSANKHGLVVWSSVGRTQTDIRSIDFSPRSTLSVLVGWK